MGEKEVLEELSSPLAAYRAAKIAPVMNIPVISHTVVLSG